MSGSFPSDLFSFVFPFDLSSFVFPFDLPSFVFPFDLPSFVFLFVFPFGLAFLVFVVSSDVAGDVFVDDLSFLSSCNIGRTTTLILFSSAKYLPIPAPVNPFFVFSISTFSP